MILEVWILQGLRSDFSEVWIVKGLAGEGCGARSGGCVITAHVSTVVHALQEVIGGNGRGAAAHSNEALDADSMQHPPEQGRTVIRYSLSREFRRFSFPFASPARGENPRRKADAPRPIQHDLGIRLCCTLFPIRADTVSQLDAQL